MKIAIVYDRVVKWGGAERVLLALNEFFPQAPLYTAVYNSKTAPWAEKFPKVVTSFLNKIPGAKNSHEKLALFMPHAFESFNFSKYDLVVSVTSEAAKGVITNPKTRHICYCLTPTRYLWSHYNEYFSHPLARRLSRPAVNYLRRWDTLAAQRPDQLVAISNEVKNRITKYYNRESIVIHPPVDHLPLSTFHFPLPISNFYLLVSRLVPYKKVDLAVKAFNELGLPLVVVGTGSEEKRLKRMAGKNIIFTGHLTDSQLADYYKKARGFIFPQREDFGIAAVEAQPHGVGVIAFAGGGALDTVTAETGVFFKKQGKQDLIKAIKEFETKKFEVRRIKQNAKRFSKERFKKEFLKLIDKL